MNEAEVGRDTSYHPLLGTRVNDSFHRGGSANFDDDDAPPGLVLQMGEIEGGHFRGGSSLSSGLVWPHTDKKLDQFLTRLYRYYAGKGLTTIVLAKLFNLFTLAFIVVFTTFLAGCIDYSILFSTYQFSEAVSIARLGELNPFLIMCLIVFALFWAWHLFYVVWEIRSLWTTHAFYTSVLGISDSDLPTTRWTDVVSRIVEVQPEDDENKRLSHHDIANIIMRRDNYLIAMYNEKILKVRIPLIGSWQTQEILTKALEWNINTCVMDFIFDDTDIKKKLLQKDYHQELVRSLRWRFYFWALLNLLFAPFIVIFLVMFFVFRYGEEVHRDPGSLGARQYTPYARMIFREFNEYPHLFERRLNASYEKARDYMQLFPYENLALISRFIAFVSGAFAVVLLVLSFVDEDILLKLEPVPGHNVLWFLGVFSAIFAIARSFIPAETLVFQPERLMRAVIEGTHYYPLHWHKQLHTDKVRRQFSRLFDYKVLVFINEIFGVITVPLILAFSLPGCADAIVEFVEKFTTKREKIGHVCTYAIFDLKGHGNPMYGAPSAVKDENAVSRNGKMEKSFLNFKAHNPTWQPDEDGVAFINNLSRFQQQHQRSFAQDMAESSTLSNSIILSSVYSAPGTRSSSNTKGKGKAVDMSTHSEQDSTQRHGVDESAVNESHWSTNVSTTLENEGMMSLLEQMYEAHESGMV